MLRKKLEQLLKIFIVICTVFSSFTLIKPVEVSAATDDTLTNVALNKAVTVSGTETDTMVGSYITDGLVPANLADSTDPNYTKRWSSNATLNETPVWAFIDLGEVTKIDKVKIAKIVQKLGIRGRLLHILIPNILYVYNMLRDCYFNIFMILL